MAECLGTILQEDWLFFVELRATQRRKSPVFPIRVDVVLLERASSNELWKSSLGEMEQQQETVSGSCQIYEASSDSNMIPGSECVLELWLWYELQSSAVRWEGKPGCWRGTPGLSAGPVAAWFKVPVQVGGHNWFREKAYVLVKAVSL